MPPPDSRNIGGQCFSKRPGGWTTARISGRVALLMACGARRAVRLVVAAVADAKFRSIDCKQRHLAFGRLGCRKRSAHSAWALSILDLPGAVGGLLDEQPELAGVSPGPPLWGSRSRPRLGSKRGPGWRATLADRRTLAGLMFSMICRMHQKRPRNLEFVHLVSAGDKALLGGPCGSVSHFSAAHTIYLPRAG